MSNSSASKSRRSRAWSTPAGEFTVCVSMPSLLSNSRSASRTSGWSSATRTEISGTVVIPSERRRLLALEPTVLELDDAAAVSRVFLGVRDLHDRRPFLIQLREQLHDLT